MIRPSFRIDIRENWIHFKGSDLLFKSRYNLNIDQVIVFKDILYIKGVPESITDFDSGYNSSNIDNVFAFDLKGHLIWNKGGYNVRYGVRSVELPVSVIDLDGEYLKLYYQSDHEVWLDRLTGEKVKEEFVFKK